jgi:hypothetical protein
MSLREIKLCLLGVSLVDCCWLPSRSAPLLRRVPCIPHAYIVQPSSNPRGVIAVSCSSGCRLCISIVYLYCHKRLFACPLCSWPLAWASASDDASVSEINRLPCTREVAACLLFPIYALESITLSRASSSLVPFGPHLYCPK